MDDSAAFSRGSSPFNSSVLTADTDDFIVGDRVWVNGNRPGYIQFLGETKFAKGDWAGIVLDDYNGKNDGSINGVHYFQCEPYRGIFSRLYRLSRFPLGPKGERLIDKGILKRSRSTTPDGRSRIITTQYNTNSSVPSYALPSRPSKVITKVTTTTTTHDDWDHNLRLGDKVVVHTKDRGMQTGRVRFVGRTTFASGQWVGVELDEPYGKNDGSVAGKRYFMCPHKYGLFAPIDKVVKGVPTRSIVKTRVINDESTRTPWRLTRFQI